MRTGGELLAECLMKNGARHGFGVPGESYLAVLDALHDYQDEFDLVIARNEGGAAFMAASFGALTGQPGLCFVTRGPGATNASIGVHTAMQNSAPMILFVGQVGTGVTGREAFQEIDYQAYFGSVAKWVVQIDQADRIPEIMSRAFSTAVSGRPGPVVVALPEDMLTATTTSKACVATKPSTPAPSAQTLSDITAMLSGAKQPLLLIGGREWQEPGLEALQEFASTNQLPVVTAFRFNDLYDNHDPCYVGDAGVGMDPELQQLIRDADVVLAAGIRLGEMTTLDYSLFDVPVATQKIIHINVSDRELGKVYAPELAVHASSNEVFSSLRDTRLDGNWQEWTAGARRQYEARLDCPSQPGPVDMAAVVAHLREVLPDDVIVTNGAGNFTAWPGKYLQYGKSARLIAPQSGAMGFGLPAAIAAKRVHPGRAVVCFAGDGDFQMNCQELGCALQYDARPIVLLVNNGSYGTIRMHQEKHYPARLSGTEIVNPDFCQLGSSYGMHAERIEATADFPAAFERAMASKTGAVLELVVSIEALTPGSTLTEIREAAIAGKASSASKKISATKTPHTEKA